LIWRRLVSSRRLQVALLVAGGAIAVAVAAVTLWSADREPPSTAPPPGPIPTVESPPPPATDPAPRHRDVAIRDGRVVVDGRPFFPILSWGECIDGFETSLPVGTNLYAANRCGGLEAQLPALGGRALSAAVVGEPIPDDPDVIGVFYPDEPDAQGATGETLPQPPRGSGIRLLTLTNHFYSGAAPLSYGRAMYPGLVAQADVVGFDLYPLQIWCRPERLVDVYFAQQELVRLAKGKPTFQWIEAAGMDCPHGRTAVTPQTVRAESWLAIAGGARGLGFFPPAAWTGDVGEAIAEVTETVRTLEPALLAPDAAASVEPAGGLVKAGARAHGKDLVVIVANAGYEPESATVRVAGLGGRTLRPVGPGREVSANGDAFTVRLPALGARVYRALG
jgi:hypothetical protein